MGYGSAGWASWRLALDCLPMFRSLWGVRNLLDQLLARLLCRWVGWPLRDGGLADCLVGGRQAGWRAGWLVGLLVGARAGGLVPAWLGDVTSDSAFEESCVTMDWHV